MLASSINIEAQQAMVDPLMQDYQMALTKYKSDSYSSALKSFSSLEAQIDDANSLMAVNVYYYKARCAMNLFNEDAIFLMESFLKDYPDSPLYFESCRNLADYYYQKRDYKNALDYYQKVDVSALRKKVRDNYKFQLAYSLFSSGENKEAASYFHDLMSNENDYSKQSQYYFAYIAYADGNYATAKDFFITLLDEGYYTQEIPVYLSQIYHQQKEWGELIAVGTQYVDSMETGAYEVARLMAEAYYQEQDYDSSIFYFDDFFKDSEEGLDDEAFYLLGQSYYRIKEYSRASSAFNKIIEAEDSLAQNAYYYLADCYLELGDKRSAQNAFESATLIGYNERITEHSQFNFAKLCYELGYPYADPTMILQDFISAHPDSEYIDEAYSYLVNAFLTHKDYPRALRSMEENGLENLRLQQAYQEVSYYRAVQLFNDEKYQQSVIHFEKALMHPHNKTFESLSWYWQGEALYRLESFEKCIATYKSFQNSASASTMSEFESASYHIAYAQFKLWHFGKSLKSFESFAGNTSSTDMRLHDAYARMGDCNYMLKDYDRAIGSYEKAIELWGVDSDYSAYQIALSYHQKGAHQKLVENLADFSSQYPNSAYRDDAYYRMGESYVKLKDAAKAIANFETIIKEFPKSAYLADAKMKIGLVQFNEGQTADAVKTFQNIVRDYPATSIAREAISNARSAYVDMGDVQAYADWVEGLSFVSISPSALDSTAFESGELQYLKTNYEKSYKAFNTYVSKYPNGAFILAAHYYLAESAVQIDSLDQALLAFDYVNEYHRNPYTLKSLKQSAEISVLKGDAEKALESFLRLDELAETVEAQLYAKQGLMQVYFELDEFQKAILEANLVLNSAKVDETLTLDLNKFIARVAFVDGDKDLSEEKYRLVNDNSQGDLKAEAMYHLAYFEFYKADYEASKALIFDQARLLPQYKEWLSKSFIILAKNFWEQEDVFQATHTLDQLILNVDDEAILKEAKSLKAEILADGKVEQELNLQLDSLDWDAENN